MKKLFLFLVINISLFAETEYFWQKPYAKQIEESIKISNVANLKDVLNTVKLNPEEKAYFLNMADHIIEDREENLNNFSMLSNSKINMNLIPHHDSISFQDYLTKFTILLASTGAIAYSLQEIYPNQIEKIGVFGIPVAGSLAFVNFIVIFNNSIKTYRTLKRLRNEALEIKELIENHQKVIEKSEAIIE